MATQLYTAPSTTLTNANLNPLGSTYASDYSHSTTDLVKRVVRPLIYDAAPQMFYDLAILDTMPKEMVNSDEFFFGEKIYGRAPLVATNSPGAVTYPSTMTLTVSDASMVTLDSVIINPTDLSKGTVTNINGTTLTITPYSNSGSFGAITSTDVIPVLGPVEADAASDIKQYFRMDVVERYNYVQMYVKAMRFGQVEMEKYKRQGTFDNYLSMNRQEWLNQIRIDVSNFYWMGTRGESTLSGTEKAKMSGGIYPTMIAANCTQVSAGIADIGTALESAALASNYKNYGATRFAYMTPELHLALSKYYKDEKTRYAPNDKMADLMLDQVRMGSSNVVLVPMQRFNDTASFPELFQKKIILVDQASITPVYFVAENYGTTLGRVNNGTLNNYETEWISMSFSQKYHNPLGGAIVHIL